jgi:chromosome segregation ATPase
VATLALGLFFGVGQAQTAPDPLQQELATMEAVFNGLESFMGELIKEIKGSMADITQLGTDLGDLRNVVAVISGELKTAEGKLIGLRQDVDKLATAQDETKNRVAALETGLAAIAQLVDKLGATLQVTRDDLGTLNQKVTALGDDLSQKLAALATDYDAFKLAAQADIAALQKTVDALSARVQKLEDEDVGTFKKKVIELERSMSALSIKIDNNRAKLEGFDGIIASLAADIEANKSGIQALTSLVEDHETRLKVVEDGTAVAQLTEQVNTLYFISIVGLLAGVGALIWGFVGQ